MQSFKIAKVHHSNTHHVTSLDFDLTGTYLVTSSSSDESINIYDACTGTHKQTIQSKKYGVGCTRFVGQSSMMVLYTSTKGEDQTIRLLDIETSSFVRYFKGHGRKVSCLEVSPLNGHPFLSAAPNDTIRLWDMRSSTCQGMMPVGDAPLVAFDPQGMIFVIALDSRFLRMYDCRSYERGPFGSFEIVDDVTRTDDQPATWSSIKFSPDGKDLLINTVEGEILLLDGFDCYVRRVLVGRPQNTTQLGMEACWSADSQYVIAGGMDGSVYSWSRSSGELISQADGHPTYPLVCRFNPQRGMIASACTNVV